MASRWNGVIDIALCSTLLFSSTFFFKPFHLLKIRLESIFHTTPDRLDLLDVCFASASALSQFVCARKRFALDSRLAAAACLAGASTSMVLSYLTTSLWSLVPCVSLCGIFLGPLWPLCVTATTGKRQRCGIIAGLLSSSLICGTCLSGWFFSHFTDTYADRFDWKHYYGIVSAVCAALSVSATCWWLFCVELTAERSSLQLPSPSTPVLPAKVTATLVCLRFVQVAVIHTLPTHLCGVHKLAWSEAEEMTDVFLAGGFFGAVLYGLKGDDLLSLKYFITAAFSTAVFCVIFVVFVRNPFLLKLDLLVLGAVVFGSDTFFVGSYWLHIHGRDSSAFESVLYANGASTLLSVLALQLVKNAHSDFYFYILSIISSLVCAIFTVAV